MMAYDEFVTDIQLRYGDIDALGHVNNAAYLTYYELARVNFLKNFYKTKPVEIGIVIARAEIDFLKPILFENDIHVGTDIAKIGKTSITFFHKIYSDDGTVYSTATIVGVFVDQNGKPKTVPEEIIKSFGFKSK